VAAAPSAAAATVAPSEDWIKINLRVQDSEETPVLVSITTTTSIPVSSPTSSSLTSGGQMSPLMASSDLPLDPPPLSTWLSSPSSSGRPPKPPTGMMAFLNKYLDVSINDSGYLVAKQTITTRLPYMDALWDKYITDITPKAKEAAERRREQAANKNVSCKGWFPGRPHEVCPFMGKLKQNNMCSKCYNNWLNKDKPAAKQQSGWKEGSDTGPCANEWYPQQDTHRSFLEISINFFCSLCSIVDLLVPVPICSYVHHVINSYRVYHPLHHHHQRVKR
jgi:hypothetical protein